jgi:hypothetical protein
MVGLVVGRLHDQRQHAVFEFFHEVGKHFTVGSACIDRRLPFEINPERLIVRLVLFPALVIVVQRFEDLSENSELSCVVYFATLFKPQSFISVDLSSRLATSRQSVDSPVHKVHFNSAENQVFNLAKDISSRCVLNNLALKPFVPFIHQILLQLAEVVVVLPQQLESLLLNSDRYFGKLAVLFLVLESHVGEHKVGDTSKLDLPFEHFQLLVHLLEQFFVSIHWEPAYLIIVVLKLISCAF